jgi:peptide chain release factor subunit 1
VNNLKEALGILLKEQYAPYLVSSLYLRLAPEDRTDRKYLRVFKNMVKAQRESLELRGLERDVLNSVVEDFEKMEDFLSEPENLIDEELGTIGVLLIDRKHVRFFLLDFEGIGEEEPYTIEDVVDEVIELALEERAVVEVIVREDLQKKFDGVGALLRWKI